MKLFKLKHNLALGSLVTALTLSACGPHPFTPSSVDALQTPAGSFNIPPKVDIVFGVSMNGTMQNIYPGIQNEIPGFLKGLQNSGWDYRFVAIPLSEYQPTTNYPITNAVSVSNYDTNTAYASWLQPYPGADYSNPALGILSSLVNSGFVIPPLDTTHNDGHETGILNQVNFLNRSDVKSNFLRPDALLAVVTISNGDDKSGGTWGFNPTYNRVMWTADSPDPIQSYANSMKALKQSNLLLKYYSVVAHLTTSCQGYGTWSGIRYEDFANRVGGTSIDLCASSLNGNGPIANALTTIASNLQASKLAFRKAYLKIGTEPNVSTIKIVKHAGGTAAGVVIPQDATNGWQYVGLVSAPGVYMIDSPILMDQETGYMIKLNGTAKLMGNDTVDVTYTNAGSVSH